MSGCKDSSKVSFRNLIALLQVLDQPVEYLDVAVDCDVHFACLSCLCNKLLKVLHVLQNEFLLAMKRLFCFSVFVIDLNFHKFWF